MRTFEPRFLLLFISCKNLDVCRQKCTFFARQDNVMLDKILISICKLFCVYDTGLTYKLNNSVLYSSFLTVDTSLFILFVHCSVCHSQRLIFRAWNWQMLGTFRQWCVLNKFREWLCTLTSRTWSIRDQNEHRVVLLRIKSEYCDVCIRVGKVASKCLRSVGGEK